LIEAQTPLAVVGLAVALTPSRRLWPAARDRGVLIVMVFSTIAIWTTYLFYKPWDAWWYLRFLLPSFPFIMLGVGALYALGFERRGPVIRVMAGAVIVVVGVIQVRTAIDRSAFRLWSGERRYVTGARMTNGETDRNSLIYAGIHVGSVRYYGSRMSIYHELLEPDWLDRSIRWLSRHGVHPYLLIEEWEVPIFRERFQGQRAVDVITGPPIAIFQEPGKLFLYDLLEKQPASARPSIWTGVDDGLWAAPKAPAPRFVLEP
jgi:hypothetical protein